MKCDVVRVEPLDQYRLHVFLVAVSWPNGQEIAPETLYSRATGEPVPDWTVAEEPEVEES